jgi:hypothetical protein
MMNKSTIIMPCNDTGFTDPQSTKGWGIVDCEYSPKLCRPINQPTQLGLTQPARTSLCRS